MALAVFVLFGAAMMAEAWAARRANQTVYRFDDTFANLACAATERLIFIAIAGPLVSVYDLCQRRWGWFSIGHLGAWQWPLGLVLVDFSHYWLHRIHHRVEPFWAAHSVHHQSRELNFSVGLRLAPLQKLFSFPFYLPLAFLGLPWTTFAGCLLAISAHQLWIHSKLIGRLGALETFLVTPTHHRVHHGRGAAQCDSNFGGLFILWDRLFRTFRAEWRSGDFGLAQSSVGLSPLEALLAPWSRAPNQPPRRPIEAWAIRVWAAMDLLVVFLVILWAGEGWRRSPAAISWASAAWLGGIAALGILTAHRAGRRLEGAPPRPLDALGVLALVALATA